MSRKNEPARPRRAWPRRLLRIALVLAALLLVLRVALPFALPSLLDSLVADAGLALRYEDMDLSLLSGDVQVVNLEVFERSDNGEPVSDRRIARLAFARLDLDMGSLLGGALRVSRLEVDGDLWLETDADGNPVLPVGEGAPSRAPQAPATGPEVPLQTVDLAPPIAIDAARVQLRLHTPAPGLGEPSDRWVEASLRVSDLGTGMGPTTLRLHAWGPAIIDTLALEGHGTIAREGIEASFEMRLEGLHPSNLSTWLRPLGLEPRAEVLAGSLRGTLQATPAEAGSVEVALDVEATRLTADGVEQAALDSARIQARLAAGSTWIRDVELVGLRGTAALREDGALGLLGVDLLPQDGPPGKPPLAEPVQDGGATLRLDRVSLPGIALHVRDEGVRPPVDLELTGDLEILGVATSPSPGDEASLSFRAQLPGIADELTLEARGSPWTPGGTADIQLRATGITLETLAPYLEGAALQPEISDGTLELHATATLDELGPTTRGSLAVTELRFADGDPLLDVERITVGTFLTEGRRRRLDGVTLQGIRLPIHRDEAGALHLLGLRTVETDVVRRVGEVARAVEAVARKEEAEEGRLEIGSLRVEDVVMSLRDDLAGADFDPGVEWFELTNLALGGAPDPAAAPQRAELDLRLRGRFMESLRLSGSITTLPGPLDLDASLALSGSGIQLGSLTPYLREAGIEPPVQEGSIEGTLVARLRQDGEGNLEIEAHLEGVSLANRAGELLSLESLGVRGGRVTAGGLAVESISLEAPQLKAVRESDGRIRIGGWILTPTAQEEPGSPGEPGLTADPAAPFATGRLELTGGVLDWRDETFDPPVQARWTLTAAADRIATGTGAPPTPVTATVTVEGARVQIEGELVLDPDDLQANLSVEATGLRSGPLAAYVPAGVEIAMEDGRFSGAFRASLGTAAEGGTQLELVGENLSLTDGESSAALLRAEALRLTAPRLDPGAGTYHVSEASLLGLELRASLEPEDRISLLGLRIGAAPRTREQVSARWRHPRRTPSDSPPEPCRASPWTVWICNSSAWRCPTRRGPSRWSSRFASRTPSPWSSILPWRSSDPWACGCKVRPLPWWVGSTCRSSSSRRSRSPISEWT